MKGLGMHLPLRKVSFCLVVEIGEERRSFENVVGFAIKYRDHKDKNISKAID